MSTRPFQLKNYLGEREKSDGNLPDYKLTDKSLSPDKKKKGENGLLLLKTNYLALLKLVKACYGYDSKSLPPTL